MVRKRSIKSPSVRNNPLPFWNWVKKVNSHLQFAMNSVENGCSSNFLGLSKEKSVTFLVQSSKRNEPGDLSVTLGCHPLEQGRCITYLGEGGGGGIWIRIFPGINNVTGFVCILPEN